MPQPWPAWKQTMDRATCIAKSGASSRMMLADLPPSSRNTRLSVAAPRSMMRLPMAVDPVNEMRSTRGSLTSISPAIAGSLAGHDIEDPGGEARLGGELAHDGAGARRVGRRLQHDRAAREQRGYDLGEVDVERHVPGRDRADDADGFVHDQTIRRTALRGVATAVLLPDDLVEELQQIVHAGDGAVDLRSEYRAHGRARFMAHDRDQPLAIRDDQIAELAEQLVSARVIRRPVRLVEGSTGGGDGRSSHRQAMRPAPCRRLRRSRDR